MPGSNESNGTNSTHGGFDDFRNLLRTAVKGYHIDSLIDKLQESATVSEAECNKIKNHENSAHALIDVLEENKVFHKTDISKLVKTFEECEIHYVAEKVRRAFERYQSQVKTELVHQLEETYKELMEGNQQIPYIQDGLYSDDSQIHLKGGIEYLDGSWKPLHSYCAILDDSEMTGTLRIIVSEPGYGNSTLSLQFTRDWCRRRDEDHSYLKDVDILIRLPLGQMKVGEKVCAATKRLLLSKDVNLEEDDIESVIQSKSVVLILDSFDEKLRGDDVDSDVTKIVLNSLFPECKVVLTTRYLPRHYSHSARLIRLTGLDKTAQDEYIEKRLNKINGLMVTRNLQKNPIIRDLCQVPFFFPMLVKMSHDGTNFQNFKSITYFFEQMMKSLHNHKRSQDPNSQIVAPNENEHDKLGKLAFKALNKETRAMSYERDNLRERLGQSVYDQNVRVGILTEHKESVTFHDKIFCEWYAANYIAKRLERLKSDELTELVKKKKPIDVPYFYCFVCGLNNRAAGKLVEHMMKTEGGDKVAILCCQELGDRPTSNGIMEIVKYLCSGTIKFERRQSERLQRCTARILEIASKQGIPIQFLCLGDCSRSMKISGGDSFYINPRLVLPAPASLQYLVLREVGREMTKEELRTFVWSSLIYASKCVGLKEVRFYDCLMPRTIAVKSHLTCLYVLESRNVQVYWDPSTAASMYYLNLKSGKWQSDSSHEEITDDEFEVANKWVTSQRIRNESDLERDLLWKLP